MWFEELKYWFIGKGLDHAIEYSLLEYAGIATPQLSSPSTETATTSTSTDDLTRGFAMFTIKTESERATKQALNVEKKDKYRAAEGQVMFVINKCVDDFDREHIRAHTTAKARWESLWGNIASSQLLQSEKICNKSQDSSLATRTASQSI
jgi:hypothetical protein